MKPTTTPARLILVATELGVGGAERCLTRLALGLDPARFQTSVVSLAGRPTVQRQALVGELEAAGVRLSFLGVSGPTAVGKGLVRLRRLLIGQQPDLIQSFLFHANVLCSLVRPRSVRHVGGVRVADPRRWRHFVQRHAARRIDKIVCVSRSVMQFCQQQEGWPVEKLVVIPNGVPVQTLATTPPLNLAEYLRLDLPQPPLVFVGRLHPQKGIDLLLPFLPEIVAKVPQTKLLILGDGPQRELLERQSRALGLSEQVHFTGWLENTAAVIRSAAALVLPSRWEGMPNAVLEAMACGKPVVATPAEGVAELLDDPRQIAPLGPEFCDRLLTLLRQPELANEIGRRNQARARERFSVEAMVQAYGQLYDTILKRCHE